MEVNDYTHGILTHYALSDAVWFFRKPLLFIFSFHDTVAYICTTCNQPRMLNNDMSNKVLNFFLFVFYAHLVFIPIEDKFLMKRCMTVIKC